MSRQIDLPPQPMVTPWWRRAGEVAGGAAADCAAVCCCCPCTVVNILVLAVIKLPAGLCKKAIRRRKRQQRLKKMKNGMYSQQQIIYGCNSPMTLEEHLSAEMKEDDGDDAAEKLDGGSEAAKWEKEMWAQFHGTGFWRSPSQRQAP